ncbi:UNVERIFIED_CONTAM: hypothetical protein HDU68_000612 [Siphonaria sp. JEL0065]|nr:hypothetical protein HDU68_000612 [Siphonaria sp. JEL0065]
MPPSGLHSLRILNLASRSHINSLLVAPSPAPSPVHHQNQIANSSTPISKHSSKPYLRTLLALNTAPGLTASKLRTTSTLPSTTTSDAQLQRRTKILRATIAIQRWFRAKRWKMKAQKGFHKQSPENDAAATVIQTWFRRKVLKWRLARLASTAKIVRILKSVEDIMAHLLVDGSGDRGNVSVSGGVMSSNNTNRIPGTCHIPNPSNSVSGSVSSGFIGGGLFADYREPDEILSMSGISDSESHTSSPQPFSRRIPSNSHFTSFSPISSPRLVPTIVQVQSNVSALHNLISEVKNVPSTSPRVRKMKQSTMSLIERYIECVLDRTLGYDLAQHQLDALHITAASSSANNSVYAPSNNGFHEETMSSNGDTTTSASAKGGMGGSFHIDKLIVIRRMEYALMQSIYGLGHGSSSGVEVITSSHEGFPVHHYSNSINNNNGNRFLHASNSSEDAAADYILSDFYDDAAFLGLEQGFGDKRHGGSGIRSRESSTVASMCEIAITDTDSEVSHDERVCGCSSRRICKRGSGLGICRNIVNPMAGVNDENAMDYAYSEAGSDVWEIV